MGPQSAADAYETLAYRNKRRRESISAPEAERPGTPSKPKSPDSKEVYFGYSTNSRFPSSARENIPLGVDLLPTPISSRVHSYEQMMGTGEPAARPVTPPESDASITNDLDRKTDIRGDEEKEDREMFMRLERPRVRYDVEVITKLIVYSG